MKDKKIRSRFGFIGFGLIGGSIARALREQYPDCTITAYNYYQTKPHAKLEQAKADGTLTSICTSLADFSACDVIFLCAPVMTNVAYLQELAPYLSDDCILTDVGSVKGDIHHAIDELGLNRQFVGGHPMTGSEHTGYANSDAALLKDAYYLLTPTKQSDAEYIDWLRQMIADIGSICLVMDYQTHDRITAGISHGPHIASAALVNTVAARDTDGSYKRLAAGGFRDITRISSSSPEMWQNICLTNTDAILAFLEEYIGCLQKVSRSIREKDKDALTEYFTQAKNYRDNID